MNKGIRNIILGLVVLSVILSPSISFAQQQDSNSSSTLSYGVSLIIMPFVTVFFSLSKGLLVMSSTALDYAMRIPVDITVVREVWEVTRDLANVFFIIALIIMAFATIFDLGSFGYSGYDWRSMLGRFIIVALLINFSLAIGQLFINASQIVTNVFLTSIGNVSTRLLEYINPLIPGVTDSAEMSMARIAATTGLSLIQLNPANPLSWASTLTSMVRSVGVDSISLASVTMMIISSIIMLITGISILAAAFFAVMRVFMMWFLLALAPLAWVSSIFPGTRRGWQNWWKYFWDWNIYLPIFTFFLYIGFAIMSRQQQIINAVFANVQASNTLFSGVGITFQALFFCGLLLFILWGGMSIAKHSSGKAADYTLDWGSKAKLYAAGRWAAYRTGVPQAYEQRKKQLEKEGLPGSLNKFYGGQEGLERRIAAAGSSRFLPEWARVRGADKKYYGVEVEKIQREYSDLSNKFNLRQITKEDVLRDYNKYKADDPRGLAYRKLMAEKGFMPTKTYFETLDQLGNNPYAVEDFANSAKAGKFGNLNELDPNDKEKEINHLKGIATAKEDPTYHYERFGKSAAYRPFREEAYKAISEDPVKLADLTYDEFKEGVGLMGGANTSDGSAFLKNVQKLNPVLSVQYKLEHPEETKTVGKNKEKLMRSAINVPAKEVAAILLPTWQDETFQAIIQQKITDQSVDLQARMKYVSTIQEELIDHPGGDKKREIFNRIRTGTDVSVEDLNAYAARLLGKKKKSQEGQENQNSEADQEEETATQDSSTSSKEKPKIPRKKRGNKNQGQQGTSNKEETPKRRAGFNPTNDPDGVQR